MIKRKMMLLTEEEELYNVQLALVEIGYKITEQLRNMDIDSSYTLLKLVDSAIRHRYKDLYVERRSEPNCLYLGKVNDKKYYKCKWVVGKIKNIIVIMEMEVIKQGDEKLRINAVMLYPLGEEDTKYLL